MPVYIIKFIKKCTYSFNVPKPYVASYFTFRMPETDAGKYANDNNACTK